MANRTEVRSDQLSTLLRSARTVQRRLRVFSASRGTRRFRRASDVLVFVLSLLLLLGLLVAYPPSRFEESLAAFLASTPGWLDPLWRFSYDLLAVWAIALLATAVVRWRYVAVLQALGSVLVAVGVAVVAARVAVGDWPDLEVILGFRAEDSSFPVVRVALSAAVILTMAPYLVRPLEIAGRWILGFGLVAATVVEPPAPSATLGAVAIALVAATSIRLAFGTSAGRPETSDVIASLCELGVQVKTLEAAGRQPAGVFVARGQDEDGRPLLVKVYGRDAYDTQLVDKLWRTAWYRSDGPRLRLSRIEAVEHEALVTLLARQAGVSTAEVVTAAESSSGDALLVVRDTSRPFAELEPDTIDDGLLAGTWRALELLGTAGIAHQHIDADSLVLRGSEVGVVGFERATLAPRVDQLLTDRAQLLATTAALVGAEDAIGAAIEALGKDGAAALLPYLQPAAFGSSLQRALAGAGIETDELRRAGAEALGVEDPELVKLRRVTWWSLVQAALLVLAATTIIGAIGGLDVDELRSSLADASWGWVALAFLVAQLPRLTQAVSTLGSVPAHLPFFPVYVMQLATGYMNLALPSNLARMAVNIRFFQRQGVAPGTAVAAGAIDSFASTAIQAALLGLLLLFSGASLSLGLETPSGDSVRLLLVLGVVAVSALVVVVAVGRIRRAIVGRVRRWWPDIRSALVGLRAPHKLAQVVGGSLATELLFAAALGLFANALGYDIGLADLLLINISVSLLASFVPIPGGIGVAEFGLTVGLVAAGMPEEAAFATVLLYRGATFYIPPVWGFLAMRWLRRNALL
jgi:glycosyltransferase 2 family protein